MISRDTSHQQMTVLDTAEPPGCSSVNATAVCDATTQPPPYVITVNPVESAVRIIVY